MSSPAPSPRWPQSAPRASSSSRARRSSTTSGASSISRPSSVCPEAARPGGRSDPVMNRRAFLIAAGSAWLVPRLADGQSPSKGYRIGWLGSPPTTPKVRPIWGRFGDRLRELGYVEGQNVVFEFRATEGQEDRFAALAAELVGLKVDLIVAPGTAGRGVDAHRRTLHVRPASPHCR